MRKLACKAVATALFAASSLASAAPAAAAGMSVRTLAAQEMRLATMAHRMATANADLCTRTDMLTGMVVHDLTQYDRGRRADVSRAFSLRSGFGVLQLVPDSAAERAGLRVDDEIIAVGRASVEDHGALSTSTHSFRRMEQFSDMLQAQLARGPATLLIRRAGQLQALSLTGERGCGGQLTLANSASLNAWADGRHIVLTTGMAGFARSDDEIAFVIAHEMAHNILSHFSGPGRMRIFGSLRARNYELDADGFAVRLMGEAGYRPDAGISFLQRSRQRMWWAFSLDHPGFGSRIRTVASEISKWQQAKLPKRQAIALRSATGVIASTAAVAPAPRVSNREIEAPRFAQSWRQTFAWRPDGPVSQP